MIVVSESVIVVSGRVIVVSESDFGEWERLW